MRLTLTLIAVFTVMVTHAQVTTGLKLGMNFANYRQNKNDKLYDTRIGINAGVVAQIHLFEKLYLQPELLYTQKGARFPSNVPVNGRIVLNYVSLALQPACKIIPELQVSVGPEVGYLVKNKWDVNDPIFASLGKNHHGWDVSINYSLAFFPSRDVAFELRYQRGIHAVNQATLTDGLGNEIRTERYGRNHVFQVNVMYFFARRSR